MRRTQEEAADGVPDPSRTASVTPTATMSPTSSTDSTASAHLEWWNHLEQVEWTMPLKASTVDLKSTRSVGHRTPMEPVTTSVIQPNAPGMEETASIDLSGNLLVTILILNALSSKFLLYIHS